MFEEQILASVLLQGSNDNTMLIAPPLLPRRGRHTISRSFELLGHTNTSIIKYALIIAGVSMIDL